MFKKIISTVLYKKIHHIFQGFQHPTLPCNLTKLAKLNYNIQFNSILYIEIIMPFVWKSGFESLQKETHLKLMSLTDVTNIHWELKYDILTRKKNVINSKTEKVPNIIAIISGKGGVGKSSVAVNLALALQKEGGRVGLLDADIYGPSIPMLLGTLNRTPIFLSDKRMKPIIAYGLSTNSIGYYLTNQRDAIIWRGPMASHVLLQLLNNTLWPELDYLILDTPPGTGDIPITLAKNIPIINVIGITTLDYIAFMNMNKSISMFEKMKIPILGIIENMSTHICNVCGYHELIFGNKNIRKIIQQQYQYPILGQLPLHNSLCNDVNDGTPIVISQPTSKFTILYRQLAGKIASKLYWYNKTTNLGDISVKLM